MILTEQQITSINAGQNYYNGAALADRFAYDFFKKDVSRNGNIILFVAPMKVEADFMVDKEDLVSKDFIYSERAVNVLIEIPDIGLYAGVCFQRLFNTAIANILTNNFPGQYSYKMKGDDILVDVPEKRKASVSIAKWVNGAVLIHTGINIHAGKEAPDFAHSTGLTENETLRFMTCIETAFEKMTQDIFLATTKILK